ncbi:uncharacterized protein LOC141626659 [Silene latifolia]|uniref:uncharacterized protein LOC141626659 n=1 Tax=Silene latifolia TaxID=37657 RepID=UPI003D785055
MDSQGKRQKMSIETSHGAQAARDGGTAEVRGGRAAPTSGRGGHTAVAGSNGECTGQQSNDSSGNGNVEQSGTSMIPRAEINGVDGFLNILFASQDQRDRDIRQSRIDQSLFTYYTYNSNAKAGYIASNTVHPSWYRFPETFSPPTSDSDDDGVASDARSNDEENSGNEDGDETDGTNPSYMGAE